ncbi:hypothetical protein LCX93_11085 [Sulfurimonas sp. SWIR-19]|uniref:hypothetical protein n=1 Tax=Sulfurimonas sp. SWIR-19 TaxID=2878390 RepID=UPI001CF497E4|nr:hypothetical protein [Sulfurimonas sp. SWIR-19]UCN00059.1 hypothetical protein LCX93_11085 [Sulfurimonas sp. SWIR-19]
MKYLGRKGSSGIYQFIINKIPKHDVYIECFFGTGFISSVKKKAKLNFGIEISSALCSKLSMQYLDVDLINGDVFIELPTLLNSSILSGKNICIYLDPPYLHETRTCVDKCRYEYELTIGQHIQLLSMLEQISNKYSNVYILLSGYKSELYMSMLPGWNYFETQCMSRGGKRIESLWCNFNPDNFIKHQYDYVGQNYTDRQRIKRKAKNLIKKLSSIDNNDERQYILECILKEFDLVLHRKL